MGNYIISGRRAEGMPSSQPLQDHRACTHQRAISVDGYSTPYTEKNIRRLILTSRWNTTSPGFLLNSDSMLRASPSGYMGPIRTSGRSHGYGVKGTAKYPQTPTEY